MNERGVLTIDFLFSMILIFALTLVFFALSFSLSMISVAQYIAFSSSRTYMAGHFTQEQQAQEGTSKLNQLLSQPVFKTLFSGGWFELKPDTQGQNGFANYETEYNSEGKDPDKSLFEGLRLKFHARVLEFNIPLFGKTYTEENKMQANINSFLSREVSESECRQFFLMRQQKVYDLDNRFKSLESQAPPVPQNENNLILDNGC